MKSLIIYPLGNIAKSIHSHKAAQAAIYAAQLKEIGRDVEIAMTGWQPGSNYDEIFVYHGNDWGGSLNLFGGLDDKSTAGAISKFVDIVAANPRAKIISLGIKFPNYHGLFHERFEEHDKRGKPVPGMWKSTDWDRLAVIQNTASVAEQIPTGAANFVVGDSHAISLYRPGYQVNSIPFKTLHGALQMGLSNLVPVSSVPIKDIEFYFGNIDIRHHLCRDEHRGRLDQIARTYVDQAFVAGKERHISGNVYIMEPLPVENESRVVPKTGWYKDTPFYGSWNERMLVRKQLVELIVSHLHDNVYVKLWTNYLMNANGELSFDHMEKPRSIHLSRNSYPYWQGHEFNKKESALSV